MKIQAGFSREIEGDDENGKRVCEVKIVDESGERRAFHVDVQANQIVKNNQGRAAVAALVVFAP